MRNALSVIVRYVTDYKINERVLGFYDISIHKGALCLPIVIEILNYFNNVKMIF